MGVLLGGLRWKGFKKALLDIAASTASIYFILMSAQMYSRALAMSGLLGWLSETIIGSGVSPYIIFIFIIGSCTGLLDRFDINFITTCSIYDSNNEGFRF